MYYSYDYLCHYGVLGMKWGQHIFGDRGLGKKSESDRRVSDTQSNSARKRQVNSERREARDRIAFYGGKNAAKANINQERDYKINKVKRQMKDGMSKAVATGAVIGLGGLALGIAVAGSATGTTQALGSLIGLGAIPSGAAVGGYLGNLTRDIGNTTITELTARADRQTAYTDDMNVTGIKVKASDPNKDDD